MRTGFRSERLVERAGRRVFAQWTQDSNSVLQTTRMTRTRRSLFTAVDKTD